MLLRFRVSNFASLRDEQELSLIALDDHDDLAVSRVENGDIAVLPVAGIYGANASGKSNLLRSFAFMRHAVVDSHQRWKPGARVNRRTFQFDDTMHERPTEFIVDALIDGTRYEYGFAVDDQQIRAEWLYSFPQRRRRVLFARSGPDGSDIEFGDFLKGRKKAIADLVRPNSLYVSAGAANNHPELTQIYRWFERRTGYISAGGPWLNLGHTLHELEERDRESVLALLRYADLGVTDVRLERRQMDQERAKRLAEAIRLLVPDGSTALDLGNMEETLNIDIVHDVRGRDFILPFDLESSGTRGWFALLGPIVAALRHGVVLIVDELNAFLHPLLVDELVRMFQRREFNRHGAQLIFNAHDVTLLSPLAEARLRRDQIWFTERGADGATHLYPLTDYRVREGLDSVFRGYLGGRYRGVPIFDEGALSAILTRQDDEHGSAPEQASETQECRSR